MFSIWLHRVTLVGGVLGVLWPENAGEKIDDISDSGDSFVHLIAFSAIIPNKKRPKVNRQFVLIEKLTEWGLAITYNL